MCGTETQTRQSLWIYTNVENMQTVCEGLHVTCMIASVDHVANLAVLRLILTLCWTNAFPLGCACFFKAYFTHDKHIEMHKEPCVYYIYKYKYILYILFFVKAVLSYKTYGCNASWVTEQDVRKYNDLYPQRYHCRKWNKSSLSMQRVFCHRRAASLIILLTLLKQPDAMRSWNMALIATRS